MLNICSAQPRLFVHWYQEFFQLGPPPADVMYGEYNLYLVLLSYVIASLASYVALDMSNHLRKPTTILFKCSWLAMGAFVMGAGIWSMHFVGMLAFIMPMAMAYDLWWTILSMVVATAAAAIAFLFFMIKKPTFRHYVMSGIILGAAIATMHYTGMAGMENVTIRYLPGLYALSILIAVVAATAALWLAVNSDQGTISKRTQLKLMSALIMGLAICGMHYIGMAAAVLIDNKTHIVDTSALDPKLMAIFITTIVISIMIIALIISTSKHYVNSILQNEKDLLEVVLNNIKGGVIACDRQGKITFVNKIFEHFFGIVIKKTPLSSTRINIEPGLTLEDLEALKSEQYSLQALLSEGIIRDKEIVILDKNKTERVLIADGQPLYDVDGKKVGAVIVYHDITEKKQAEQIVRNEMLQKEMAQKKLDALNSQLVIAARRAGMAEIATSVLHNIGNLMNSVNVAALSLQEHINETKFTGLTNLSRLVIEHQNDLHQFITEDPQGKNFVDYISKIGGFWEQKQKIFSGDMEIINKNVQNIKDVIAMQQSLTGSRGLIENTLVNDVIEEALKLNESTFPKNNVTIVREYDADISIMTDKSKLLQILVNLIRNAYEALLESDIPSKIINVSLIKNDNNTIDIKIQDNGKGIKKEDLIKIFTFGFTTKKNGHGIGLHTSALAANELGGSLNVDSPGVNLGSIFILILPKKFSRRKEGNL